MKYLLDTNIISEPMKKSPNTRVMNKLALETNHSATSATVWHELNYGIERLASQSEPTDNRIVELRSYLQLLIQNQFEIISFDRQAAEWLAVERARLNKLGITPAKYDSEIAAVAVANNLIVITRNTKDFVIYEDLLVENWFS